MVASGERVVTEPGAELLLSCRHQKVPAGDKKHHIAKSKNPQEQLQNLILRNKKCIVTRDQQSDNVSFSFFLFCFILLCFYQPSYIQPLSIWDFRLGVLCSLQRINCLCESRPILRTEWQIFPLWGRWWSWQAQVWRILLGSWI